GRRAAPGARRVAARVRRSPGRPRPRAAALRARALRAGQEAREDRRARRAPSHGERQGRAGRSLRRDPVVTTIDEVRALLGELAEVPRDDEAPLALDSLTLVQLVEAIED